MSLVKTFKKSVYFGLIPKISAFVNILMLPFITPYLSPYDYGIWGIISSYSSLFLAIAPLGIHIHLTNSYFEYKRMWNIVWGRILCIFFVSGVFFALIFSTILFFELDGISWSERFLIVICSSIPILLFGNATLASNLYPLKGEPRQLVFRNLIASLFAIIILFIVVYVFKLGFWGFILGSSASAIVTFILFVNPLYKKENIRPHFEKNIKRLKNWMKISLPVIPHSLGFMLLSSSSRIVMAWSGVPLEDIGLFSNGFMVGDYITIVTTALVTALAPQIQLAYRTGNYLNYRHLFYLCQITTLVAIFCFSLWMPEIYRILIRNESLQQCSAIASYICFANALLPLYTFISTIVFVEKKTVQLLWLVFIPGTLNLLLCLIFIPIFGYKVAIYSTLLAYWSLILIPFISSYHKNRLRLWLGSRCKLFVLIFLLLLALYVSIVISNSSILTKICFSFFIIFMYFFVLKYKHYDTII